MSDGTEEMFGPPPAESVFWDQPDPNAPPGEESKSASSTVDLGNGNSFAMDPNAMAAVVAMPGLAEAMLAEGKKLADRANQNATIEGAQYEAVLVRDADGIPNVVVRTANELASIDEAAYATLTAASTSAVAENESSE